MMRVKMLAPAVALAIAGAATAACGTSGSVPATFSPRPGPVPRDTMTWPGDTQVRAWVKAHPVPPVAGMTAGVVSFSANAPVWMEPCPRTGHGSRGEPGMCASWQVTLVTASGELTVTCGRPGVACTSFAYPAQGNPMSTVAADDHDFPLEGDYLYAPASGQVVRASDVQVIRRAAVPLTGWRRP
jgi:hypothetical protein